jgi:hypothetical protein
MLSILEIGFGRRLVGWVGGGFYRVAAGNVCGLDGAEDETGEEGGFFGHDVVRGCEWDFWRFKLAEVRDW